MIPGYELGERLAESEWQTLWRGRRRQDQRSVLIKLPRRDPPSSTDLDLLEREASLLAGLRVDGIPRCDEFVRVPGRSALVFEDSGGRTLRERLRGGALSIETSLRLAHRLASLLAESHRRHIVHRHLQPESILCDGEGERMQLFDWQLASRSSSEESLPLPMELLRGALTYISPEQTGRINRAVDYRTDLYSLGIIFYELVTGRPPFPAGDALELIHCHIARVPRAPADLVPMLPQVLSEVISRLIEKTPEERYQSATGLCADLALCLDAWRSQGQIPTFCLGANDVSDRFLIPQILYGREPEVQALGTAFERACNGHKALVIVEGYAGVGKTSLILELYRPIVQQRGYFLSGKFDQVVRSVPFGALWQAFRGLVRQWLGESEERLAHWQSRLTDALGANAGVLTSVIPEMEWVIGKQPPPATLGSTESQNRFHLVLQQFLAALARPEHPLVLFLDDLQWADAATLSLLEPLLESRDIGCMLVVGAYRENEVYQGHPLLDTLSQIEAAGAELLRLSVGPLSLTDLTRLVADVLHTGDASAEPLARLVLGKTGGNPLFVTQFLRTLEQEGLLEFDHRARSWVYHLAEIAAARMTDDVVVLMTRKLERLSPRAQSALTLAACIGNPFDARTLGLMSQSGPEQALIDLQQAVHDGLIVAQSTLHDLPSDGHESGFRSATLSYAFAHDRIQQAAYGLIAKAERDALHLGLGRLLLAEHDPERNDERLFDIAHHLNVSSELITEPSERLALARLDLHAGRKAKAATAREAALGYFCAGAALLGEAAWSSHYELMFSLELEAAECASHRLQFDDAERRFKSLLERARTDLDRARVYNLKMVQYESRSRYADALDVARRSLGLFGVDFPESEPELADSLAREIDAILRLLDGRAISTLIDLPVMQDAETRMLMDILTDIWSPAYILGEATLARLISATMVRLSLEHGNTAESAYGYVTHAITVGPVRGDHAAGYEFGLLALRVNERFEDSRRRAKIHQQFHAHVNLWRQPFNTCIAYARRAYASGVESGDFVYATYAAVTETWPARACCADLGQFVRDYAPNLALSERLGVSAFQDLLRLMLNWARALRGETLALLSLSGADLDEQAYVARYRENPFFSLCYYVAKLHVCLLLEADDVALDATRQARALSQHLTGTIWPVWVDFWGGLVLARVAHREGSPERAGQLAALESARATLSALAESCPENFLCPALLLSAELERLSGRERAALELCERAIARARDDGLPEYEAVANELAGRSSLASGQATLASAFLVAARGAYARWGADAKVQSLDHRYSNLFATDPSEGPSADSEPPISGVEPREPASVQPGTLDLYSVMKAAEAITRETELEKLLVTLMRIVIENAGAERGSLVISRMGALFVHARGSLDGAAVTVQDGLPLCEVCDLAGSVVHYVCRTLEPLVLADARADVRSENDPYVRASAPRSLMCVPILQQGRLLGALYLENNLLSGAFTPERTAICQMLASHSAIAIENARLFDQMRREIALRKRGEDELRSALQEVERLQKRLQAENVYLQEEIRLEHNMDEIRGSGPPLMAILEKVARIAPTDSTVLIQGETGTGKELIARAIHGRSTRRDRPLVKVNCGAIAAGLVESELFGHVRGAFTGATERRIGRFELADGGTLFLDEVGELAPDVQVKLLRVLQEGEFEPVGSSRTQRVNVRIIAATNRALELAIREGRFRSDLYYRLNVLPILLPPLRERRSDIPELISCFVARFARQLGKVVEGIAPESLQILMDYDWPGNIRELENVIERGVVLSQGPWLRFERDLLSVMARPPALEPPPASSASASNPAKRPTAPGKDALDEVQRQHILAVLERTGGTVEGPNGAAKLLGLHPNTLRSRLKKLGIRYAPRAGSGTE